MGKLLYQNGIAGHGTAGEAARDEDITRAVLQHDKSKILAQLDHLAQQGLVGAAGTHRKENALPLADHSLVHLSLIHICYKAEYARRHLGESYEGRISGVTQRGLP